MGQAAGGGPGLVLMTSPMARGLFHRAILPAAGYPGDRADLPPLGDLAAGGLARELGATGEGAALLAALRAIPAEALVRAGGWPVPVIDGRLIVEPPEAAIAAGRQAMVPIVAGAHLFEGGVGMARDKAGLFAWFGPLAAQARAAYDPGGDVPFERIARQVMLDGVILEPARRLAQAMARAGQPVWHYRFSYEPEARRSASGAASHASEIPFMFGTARGVLGEQVTAADQAMARNVLAYWAAFARTGDPNDRYRPRWRRFDPESGAIMEFTTEGPWSGPDPLRARLDVVQARREGRAPPPGPGPDVAGAMRPYAALFLPPTRPARGRPSAIFLGAASLLLTDGPHAIVVNGFVTRPSEAEVRGGRIAPDFFRVHELRERFLIPFIDAALVSDSHFDHSMDAVSWVRYSPALLIGSVSTANLGRGSGVEEAQLRVARDREIFALGPFRVTAIAAPHAPHGVGEAVPGTIDAPLPPPIPVFAYREGGSYSFLIAHERGRILVHASAGFRPGLMRGVRADTVLLGIAGLGTRDARFVEAYWREIVQATGARIVVPVHWDRSGVPLGQPLEPGADFVRAMEMLTRLAARDGVALRLMPALEQVDPFFGDATR